MKYDDKYININVNWLNPYKEQRMSIIGEKGMLVFDDTAATNKLTYFPEYISFKNDIQHIPLAIKDNAINIEVDVSKSPLLNECTHFIQCCKTREKPITNGEEGLRVLQILNALQQSLNNGKEIVMSNLNVNKTQSFFKHETAIIDEGASIGEGTKIWHYSHICKGAKIGKNCNIGQNVFIAGDAVIGDNCKVQNNVSIYAGVEAGNYVFFGPSCVLTNDINPRGMHSKAGHYIKTKLEDGVTLGANSTVVCGHTIGKHALIGAGAVVTKNVEPYSVMVGNPAKRISTIDEIGNRKKINL